MRIYSWSKKSWTWKMTIFGDWCPLIFRLAPFFHHDYGPKSRGLDDKNLEERYEQRHWFWGNGHHMRNYPRRYLWNPSSFKACWWFQKSTLQETNMSLQENTMKMMIFLFPRWDMLVPWRLAHFTCGRIIHFELHISFPISGLPSSPGAFSTRFPEGPKLRFFFKNISPAVTHTFRMVLSNSSFEFGKLEVNPCVLSILRGSGYLVYNWLYVGWNNPRIWGHITHGNRGYNPGYYPRILSILNL